MSSEVHTLTAMPNDVIPVDIVRVANAHSMEQELGSIGINYNPYLHILNPWVQCDPVSFYMRIQLTLSCPDLSWLQKAHLRKYEPVCVTWDR